MVNVGLPMAATIWFRIGDDPFRTGAMPSIEYLRRIESIGFLTNFQRLESKPDTRRLSTLASLIAIARPIATG
jgi:hypothetical protein